MADEEEKVVPQKASNGNLILIIGVALIVISLALSAVSLITIMGISKQLTAPEEDEMVMDSGEISLLEINTFKFSESFIFIFESETMTNNVVVDISIGVHNTAEDAEAVSGLLTGSESIIRDGVERLVKQKSFSDFETAESMDAVKAEILTYLQERLVTESIIDVYFNNLLTTSKEK